MGSKLYRHVFLMAYGKGSNGMTVLNSTSSNPEQTKENEQKQRGTATETLS